MNHDFEPGHLTTCLHCRSSNMASILDLGFHEPCDSLPNSDDLKTSILRYPLNLLICNNCKLVQIDYVVDKKVLFHKNYPYRSGITSSLVEKLKETAHAVLSRFSYEQESLVVDIGSNDGSLLTGFKELGMNVLGVEASDIARIANENGIETIQDFFNEKTSQRIVKLRGKAKIITATNVFAHVSDTTSIMKGVLNLLDDDGVFITESHYLADLVQKNQFDSIYHEHLKYYSLQSIEFLLNSYQLHINGVDEISNYGGSIRVYASRQKNLKPDLNVIRLKELEVNNKLNEYETLIKFKGRVELISKKLTELIIKINVDGHSIVGAGAPGRSSTLLEFCGLNSRLIPVIYEQATSLKLNKFTPTTHIPIRDEKEMFENQPDYVLLLSWHYADNIIKKFREKGLKSKIIVPLPEIKIIE